LPKYETVYLDFSKSYQSTVTVQGVKYTGMSQPNKKKAERAAAEEVLKALELMA